MLLRYLLLLLSCLPQLIHAANQNRGDVVIGAMFDKNAFMRKAFALAVRTMNECKYNHEICEAIRACDETEYQCQEFHDRLFTALVLEVEDDPISVVRQIEVLTGIKGRGTQARSNTNGLAAIFGPHYGMSGSYVQGFCEGVDVPHIIVRRELEHDRLKAIDLYPDVETLSTVYVKMIEKLNWTSFSILYESTENFLALDNVLKMYGPYAYPVYAFYLGPGPNYSQPLLMAKEKNHKSLIIDCSFEHLADILKQTQEVGMMTDSYRYIITSLDLQTIDLRPYQYSGVNISGLRMVDPDDPFVRQFVGSHLQDLSIPSTDKLRTEEALIFDAVALFAQSYKDLAYKNEIRPGKVFLSTDKLITDNLDAWSDGLSLRNYILYNTINGLTGPVMMDSDGSRRRFKLDILNLHINGLMKVGTWNPDDGFDDLNLMNEIKMKHFKVLITMNPPYAMPVNYSKSLEGNDRYEGFVVDIIKELSAMIGFNYTFYVQENAQNGICNKTQNGKCTCTDMMEKILTGEMDMAITDLTITEEREMCVDFSTAFWNLGMSILYQKPKKAPATMFSFLSPFQSQVWLNLVIIYAFVSVLFYLLGRISPAEWNNPYPCIDDPDELVNQFTISNSFWFTMGAIMQQGSEIAPIALSTRVLAGSWWFFCLIMVSSYLANLAAFLTIESPVKVVRGIEDLYNQTNIKFGAKKGGSTFMYFKSSKNQKHQALARIMETKEWQDKWMVSENSDGIRLAKTENYAFIMESSSIEYIENRECELQQAGPLIDQKSYAIAYAENFEYHQQISRSISILQEKLVIKELYDKWWKEKGAVCFVNNNSNTGEAMNLDQLAGVFLVMGIGVAISLLLSISEFVRGVKRIAHNAHVSFMKTLKMEVKYITGSKSVKPASCIKRRSVSNMSDNYSCDYTMTTQA